LCLVKYSRTRRGRLRVRVSYVARPPRRSRSSWTHPTNVPGFSRTQFSTARPLLARPRASIIKTSQQLRVTSAHRSRRIDSTGETQPGSILRDIARREARRAPRLQPGAVVELSIVATSLWQRPGVLLDGARVDGVGPRAAADLHRPRVPQAARLRQADRERVVLPRRRHRRGTTASMM
jgi:hypothetical protein